MSSFDTLSRLLSLWTIAVLSPSCAADVRLPAVTVDALDELTRDRPTAVLFSMVGCRYCDIAERGFLGAATELRDTVHVRKVMIGPQNQRAIRSRYGVLSAPDARLLLPDGRVGKLPLTREGARVAAEIRVQAAEPLLRRSTISQ